jgi:hypothetical protein
VYSDGECCRKVHVWQSWFSWARLTVIDGKVMVKAKLKRVCVRSKDVFSRHCLG